MENRGLFQKQKQLERNPKMSAKYSPYIKSVDYDADRRAIVWLTGHGRSALDIASYFEIYFNKTHIIIDWHNDRHEEQSIEVSTLHPMRYMEFPSEAIEHIEQHKDKLLEEEERYFSY
jgi:thioredoxin reductase